MTAVTALPTFNVVSGHFGGLGGSLEPEFHHFAHGDSDLSIEEGPAVEDALFGTSSDEEEAYIATAVSQLVPEVQGRPDHHQGSLVAPQQVVSKEVVSKPDDQAPPATPAEQQPEQAPEEPAPKPPAHQPQPPQNAASQEGQAQPAAGGILAIPRRRCVLVAKCLTNSDASSGRIILPRVAVETNLPFVLGYRHYTLAVRDCRGQRHEFKIKSWANGTEHRRVFVLEQATDYLRAHGVGVGDAVGICTDENGELVVETNTPEVRQATVCPKYGALAVNVPPPAAGAAVPLVLSATARCARSVHCTKPAGHPGFCSGPKAAAAAAAAARGGAGGRGKTVAAASPRCASLVGAATAGAPCAAGDSEDVSSDEAGTVTRVSGGCSPTGSTAAAFGPRGLASRQCASSCRAEEVHALELPPGLPTVAEIPAGTRIVKVLTGYDLNSKHVVMPAPDVECGVSNALTEDLLTLAAVDESQGWQFPMLRAWSNLAHRRGYLLEGASDFLYNRGAAPGDTLVLYRQSEYDPPRLELRASNGHPSLRLRLPVHPDSAMPFTSSLPLPLALEGGEHGGNGRCGSSYLLCRRTAGCTKHAGHQGFCSGHKGFKRSSPGHPGPAGRQRQLPRVFQASRYLPAGRGAPGNRWDSGDDEDYTPFAAPSLKRRRRVGTIGASRLAVAAAAVPAVGAAVEGLSSEGGCDPLLSLLSLLGEEEERQAGPDSLAASVVAAAEHAEREA